MVAQLSHNLEPVEDSGSAVHEAAREESPLSDSVQ